MLAALDRTTPIAGKRFPPGATIWIGSNSGNDLVLPEKLELTSYKLIARGSVLHLAPPLHVQASVWLEDAPVELKGYVRQLRRMRPTLPMEVSLASAQFVIAYDTGLRLIGRFDAA